MKKETRKQPVDPSILSKEEKKWVDEFFQDNNQSLLATARRICQKKNLGRFGYDEQDLLNESYLAMGKKNVAMIRHSADTAVNVIFNSKSVDLVRRGLAEKRGGSTAQLDIDDPEAGTPDPDTRLPPNLQEDVVAALTGLGYECFFQGPLREIRCNNLAQRGDIVLTKYHKSKSSKTEEKLWEVACQLTWELLPIYLESERKGDLQEAEFRKTFQEVVEDLFEEGQLGSSFQSLCCELLLAVVARMDQKYNENERNGKSTSLGQVFLRSSRTQNSVHHLLSSCRKLRVEDPMAAVAVCLKFVGLSHQEIGEEMGLGIDDARSRLAKGQEFLARDLGIVLKTRSKKVKCRKPQNEPNNRDGAIFS